MARLDIKGASSMGVVSDDGSVSTRKSARAGLAVKITTGNAAPKRVREVKATPAVLAAAASTASASRKRKKEGRCAFFMVQKQRTCSMRPAPGNLYCGVHNTEVLML